MIMERIFNKSSHILVVGDVMLDGYANGLVDRISPEAPVPVLNHMHHHEVAGGASNVAMNIVALGGQASLVGVIGDDEEGRRLENLLTSSGVHTSFIQEDSRPTISKLRIVSGNHQLLRIDKESKGRISNTCEQMLIDNACRIIVSADAVILSDYMKGCLSDIVLQAVINAARAKGIPVFVDPKRKDLSHYAGADYITPNRKELTAATGVVCVDEAAEREAARIAMAVTGGAVLLTRSEDGMVLFSKDGQETWLPTESKEVFDVSGAGDTVVASFALAVSGGLPAEQALRIANCAAGIVIGKLGTATVSSAELLRALQKAHTHIVGNETAVSLQEACRLREQWRREKLVVGFTNGCFDLVHPGHIALLRESALACDRLIVAINSDTSVKRLKGESRPIQDENSRAIVMSAISDVDLVIIFGEDTPLEVIKALLPDVLIKGGDYQEHEIVGGDLVKAAGGSVHRVNIIQGQSTSSLVTRSASKSAKTEAR